MCKLLGNDVRALHAPQVEVDDVLLNKNVSAICNVYGVCMCMCVCVCARAPGGGGGGG